MLQRESATEKVDVKTACSPHRSETVRDPGFNDTEDEFLGSIFNLEAKRKRESRKSGLSAPAVKVPVQIEDVQFQMEVDTGAAASILNYADYERYFKYLALRPVERSFHAVCWLTAGRSGSDFSRRGAERATGYTTACSCSCRTVRPSFTRKILDDENSPRLGKPFSIFTRSVLRE